MKTSITALFMSLILYSNRPDTNPIYENMCKVNIMGLLAFAPEKRGSGRVGGNCNSVCACRIIGILRKSSLHIDRDSHMHLYAYIYTHSHTQVHTYVRAYIYIYIYIYMHRTHTHTHARTHTHTLVVHACLEINTCCWCECVCVCVCVCLQTSRGMHVEGPLLW